MIHGRETALYLAREAALAYDPYTDGVHVGGELSCHAVIRRTGKNEVVVAFRGTGDADGWLSNLAIGQAPWMGCRVHCGFLQSYQSIHQPLVDALIFDVHWHSDDQLWLCGHSRGGAQAVIAAAQLRAMGFAPTGVYTFGAPRVGDASFAAQFDHYLGSRAHRYVYQSDLVPRFPRLGYRHCGRLHWHDGRAWRDSMPLFSSVGAYLFQRKWPFIGDAARDHGVGQYIGALS